MKEVATAPADSFDEGHTWMPAQERWQEQRRLVGICVAAYRAVKDLPAIGAFNPDIQSRSPRWTPESAHYAIDIENTVRRVIGSKPTEVQEELWVAWESLLTGDAKIGRSEQKLVRALAPILFHKKMHPSDYFRPNRHPQRRGVR